MVKTIGSVVVGIMSQNKTEFTDAELLRYSRHILLPSVDVAGQLAFSNARALIIGMGGLGSPVAQYLAAAGVGQLHLVDFDQVEESNLQRQVLHNQTTLGANKVDSAQRALALLNPHIAIETTHAQLCSEELAAAVQRADVVLDCSDNFPTRQAINLACFTHQTPLVSGAAIRMEGQLSVYDFRDSASPCYQCLFPVGDDTALTCSQSGILSPIVGVIGSMQAVEALKVLGHFGKPLVGRLLLYDGAQASWRELRFRRDPDCSVCGAAG